MKEMNKNIKHGVGMNSLGIKRVVILLSIMSCFSVVSAVAHIADKARARDKSQEDVQRDPAGIYDLQKNVVSSLEFYTTNYGIFGYDVRNQIGGGRWPRGSQNQYLFAGGAWFAAQKIPPSDTSLRKRVMVTYNPNNGRSWMVPGTIEDGPTVMSDAASQQKYRVYFSTDVNPNDGTSYADATQPAWPIWDTNADDTVRFNNYFGNYVNDASKRTKASHSKGPAFISGEDVFSVFKDTDLSRYDDGSAKRRAEGFPFGFQIEQTIYTWGFGDYRDLAFNKYLFIHPTTYTDTLYQCWMGAVMDVDITLSTNPNQGAQNDRARYYSEEDSLNMAVQWTNGDRGEAGRGFGYLGFNFLESPAVDADGFIRKDKRKFPVQEQLGLRTMRNWPIQYDPQLNEERYNFMASGQRDGDDGPGDRRMLMCTGPFNVRPGDSARIVVGIILAATATGNDATGTTEDMAELVRKVRFAQSVYNNSFRAPEPPKRSVIKGIPGVNGFTFPSQGWLPLNNAVAIQWDSTSELSIDTLERGLDFFGYRVYRTRRTDLDTFDVDEIQSKRKGPLGWKELARFQMVSPFIKSTVAAAPGTFIDEFDIIDVIKPGQKRYLVARRPTISGPWGAVFMPLYNKRAPDYQCLYYKPKADSTLDITKLDRADSISFVWFTSQFETLPTVGRRAGNIPACGGAVLAIDSAQAARAKDSLIKLILARKIKIEPFMFNDTNMVPDANGDLQVQNVKRSYEETNECRRGPIASFMRTQSQGRVFFDDGDDNNDGSILYSTNPNKSEKLINNMDYYYRVLAFDEGDYLLPTPAKLNDGAPGLPNVVKTMPLAARVGDAPSISVSIPPSEQAKLGGIYNVRFLVADPQRFNQMFGGRTLKLEFFRAWTGVDVPGTTPPVSNGLYALFMSLRDSSSNQQIGGFFSLLPPELCPTGAQFTNKGGAPGFFTENARTWVDTNGVRIDTIPTNPPTYDTVTFGVPTNRDKLIRYGTYTSDAPCFGTNKYALSTVGIAFDYAIEQWGGVYRNDTGEVVKGPKDIYAGRTQTPARTFGISEVPPAFVEIPYEGFQGLYERSFNNGPGVYQITFSEGGSERITTKFKLDTRDDVGKDSTMTFDNVPYLNFTVRNVYSFDRDQVSGGTTTKVPVGYQYDLKHVTLPVSDTVTKFTVFPDPELLKLDEFNFGAYGWRNARKLTATGTWDDSQIRRQYQTAGADRGAPVRQGRYYLSRNLSTTGTDTLDFCHIMNVGGAELMLDWSWKSGRFTNRLRTTSMTPTPAVENLPKEDFKAGDVVRLSTFGGAFGFPMDSTRVYARVAEPDPIKRGGTYTDDQLEQVSVVPNPFVITHEGMRSPYESKIYFTRLPRECTISIYTTDGSLLRTFTHTETETSAPSQLGTDVWDLLSSNRQRAASQMLVAKIETPDGASIIRKFTIVVGPARIIGDSE